MREEWLAHCIAAACRPADFYSGCRKIHTGVTLSFVGPLSPTLRIEDAGFTRNKMAMLRRLYHSDEHAEQVAALWRRRVEQDKYGSVGYSTYHHLLKADPEKRSKRASVMGPCLLAVTLTLLPDRTCAVDAFYRTSELFKKFPADLVHIRDVVLPSLGVDAKSVSRLRCHFAGLTSHPMYAVTWLALSESPSREIRAIRDEDEFFWKWIVKWTARYVCDEYAHGIQKFAQALRVAKDANARIRGPAMVGLQRYLRDNHPGYKHTRFNHDDEGEEDGE